MLPAFANWSNDYVAFLPQPSNIFTQIYLQYLWHFATLSRTSSNMDLDDQVLTFDKVQTNFRYVRCQMCLTSLISFQSGSHHRCLPPPSHRWTFSGSLPRRNPTWNGDQDGDVPHHHSLHPPRLRLLPRPHLRRVHLQLRPSSPGLQLVRLLVLHGVSLSQ